MELNNNSPKLAESDIVEIGPTRRRTAIPLWANEGDDRGESMEILQEIEVILFLSNTFHKVKNSFSGIEISFH